MDRLAELKLQNNPPPSDDDDGATNSDGEDMPKDWSDLVRCLQKYNPLQNNKKKGGSVAKSEQSLKTLLNTAYEGAFRQLFANAFPDGVSYVYILRLENNKWYVGQSNYLSRRLAQHFLHHGSYWTRAFTPLAVYAIMRGGVDVEKSQTLAMMREHGWNNVRGSDWTMLCDIDRPVELDVVTMPCSAYC